MSVSKRAEGDSTTIIDILNKATANEKEFFGDEWSRNYTEGKRNPQIEGAISRIGTHVEKAAKVHYN